MTISFLMDAKKPGELKLRLDTWPPDQYFVPFFMSPQTLNWHGLFCDRFADHYWGGAIGWKIYEPKENT